MSAARSPAMTQRAVVIVAAEPPLTTQIAAAQAAGANLVELRVDRIGDVRPVVACLQAPAALPRIVTVRRSDEGGAWTKSDGARRALLLELARLRPEYVDIEYATWAADAELRAGWRALDAATRPRLILSHHDFTTTPAELTPVFDRLAAAAPDIVKAVFTAEDATDALRVLAELRTRATTSPTIALAMGPAGLATRVLAAKVGGFLTFVSLAAGAESAPGQLTAREFSDLYRGDRLGPATRVFGVVGWPVAHSLSPLIHNRAMTADGLDGVYLPLPVRPTMQDFTAFMDFVAVHPELGLAGLSVTVPHKEHAADWLTGRRWEIRMRARRCGAVNTLTRNADGTWVGDNTDVAGLLAALVGSDDAGERLRGVRAAVLGAGGVARAAVAALSDAGAQITVFNRTAARAQQLADAFGVAAGDWSTRVPADTELIINCTSVGMWPHVDDTPLPAECIPVGATVMDTIYRPHTTRLLREAAARGCRTIDGCEMFVQQAAAQYGMWHAREAPVLTLRAALADAEHDRSR